MGVVEPDKEIKRTLKYPVHRSLNGQYYVDKKSKIECIAGGIVFGFIGVLPAILFVTSHNYTTAFIMGIIGGAMSFIFICYPSFILYQYYIELTEYGVEYSGMNCRFFKENIVGIRFNYSDIHELFVGFYKPPTCRDVDDEYWSKMFGPYIVGKNEKGNICFAFSYQEDAWNILVEKCKNTAGVIADEQQYQEYLEERRKLEKITSDKNGGNDVIDSYSGYIN